MLPSRLLSKTRLLLCRVRAYASRFDLLVAWRFPSTSNEAHARRPATAPPNSATPWIGTTSSRAAATAPAAPPKTGDRKYY